MKIVFDHSSPFMLAHGGVQVQIEQTKRALERIQVEVEFARWWDADQHADIIHYFGAVPSGYLNLARQKRIPIVLSTFFSETCNRSDFHLRVQGIVTRGLLALPGWELIKAQLQWRSYKNVARIIVGTNAERHVLQTVYGIQPDRIDIVPLGLDEIYLTSQTAPRDENYLISVGTVREVKRSIELAQLARDAKVPILFVGDPYSIDDPYWGRFQRLIDNEFVLHQNHIAHGVELKKLLLSARGFVLYSEYENWSLAAHEAAACRIPLLLPDMKWSRECFGDQARYFSSRGRAQHAAELSNFYATAENLPAPKIANYTWDNVATKLISIYQELG